MVYIDNAVVGLLGGFVGGVGLTVALILRKGWIQGIIYDQILNFMEDLPAFIAARPELMADLTKPVISAFVTQLQAGGPEGKMKDLKIGGFRIPGELAAMAAQYMMQGAASGAKEGIKNALLPG